MLVSKTAQAGLFIVFFTIQLKLINDFGAYVVDILTGKIVLVGAKKNLVSKTCKNKCYLNCNKVSNWGPTIH